MAGVSSSGLGAIRLQPGELEMNADRSPAERRKLTFTNTADRPTGKFLRAIARPAAGAVEQPTRQYDDAIAAAVGEHPDAPIFASFPGVGAVLTGVLLAEIGEDRHRFPESAVLPAEAGLAPVTRGSGRSRVRFRYAANWGGTAPFFHRDNDVVEVSCHDSQRRGHRHRRSRPTRRPLR
jgi:hypothetical protein